MKKKYVAYYRVSTGKQDLGLEAQRSAVSEYANGDLIAEFEEKETGTRKKKRIEIYKAIELVKKENAILLVAKLDRLARDVEFTSALFNSGVEFICCDNPHANKMTIQLLSVVAEDEAERISKRTKDGLKAKRKRIEKGIYINKDGSKMKPDKEGNYRLGNPKGFNKDHQKLGLIARQKASATNEANIKAMGVIADKRFLGWSYKRIATYLNDKKYLTARGKSFNPMQVQRLYKKCDPLTENEERLKVYLRKNTD